MKKETYTPEEIRKRFDALPVDIKSVVYGADMLGLIQKIGGKYKLHIDQLDVLEAETADVMTGFSKPEDFTVNLSTSLSIDRTQAENIAKDINEGLFLKIRESLKRLYSEEKAPAVQMPLAAPVITTKTPAPKPIEPHPADIMLTQKTVTTAPSAPMAPKPATPVAPVAPKPASPAPITPQPYKADPYREPTE